MPALFLRLAPSLVLFAAGLAAGWWYVRHSAVHELEQQNASLEVTIATLHTRLAHYQLEAARAAAETLAANEEAGRVARRAEDAALAALRSEARASGNALSRVSSGSAALDFAAPDALVAPVRRMREAAVRAGDPAGAAGLVSPGTSLQPD